MLALLALALSVEAGPYGLHDGAGTLAVDGIFSAG